MTIDLSRKTLSQSQRSKRSLADDSTAVTPLSTSSKQPSDYQVITESCEWCMVSPPWTGEEYEESDPMKITGSPKFVIDPPRTGKLTSIELTNDSDTGANCKTLGPKMI